MLFCPSVRPVRPHAGWPARSLLPIWQLHLLSPKRRGKSIAARAKQTSVSGQSNYYPTSEELLCPRPGLMEPGTQQLCLEKLYDRHFFCSRASFKDIFLALCETVYQSTFFCSLPSIYILLV